MTGTLAARSVTHPDRRASPPRVLRGPCRDDPRRWRWCREGSKAKKLTGPRSYALSRQPSALGPGMRSSDPAPAHGPSFRPWRGTDPNRSAASAPGAVAEAVDGVVVVLLPAPTRDIPRARARVVIQNRHRQY